MTLIVKQPLEISWEALLLRKLSILDCVTVNLKPFLEILFILYFQNENLKFEIAVSLRNASQHKVKKQ